MQPPNAAQRDRREHAGGGRCWGGVVVVWVALGWCVGGVVVYVVDFVGLVVVFLEGFVISTPVILNGGYIYKKRQKSAGLSPFLGVFRHSQKTHLERLLDCLVCTYLGVIPFRPT